MGKRQYASTKKTYKAIVYGIKTYQSTKQIADSIGLSQACIHYHIRNLFNIYGVKNRRELFLYLKGLPDLAGVPDSPVIVKEYLVDPPVTKDKEFYHDKLKIALICLQNFKERFPKYTSMHRMADICLNQIGMSVVNTKLVEKKVVNL